MKTSVCSTARILTSQRTSQQELHLIKSQQPNASSVTQAPLQLLCAIPAFSTPVQEPFARPAIRPAAEDASAPESASSVTIATASLAAISTAQD